MFKRFFSQRKQPFILEKPDWTPEDDDNMLEFTGSKYYETLKKRLHHCNDGHTEDILDGGDTKDKLPRIDENVNHLRYLEGLQEMQKVDLL